MASSIRSIVGEKILYSLKGGQWKAAKLRDVYVQGKRLYLHLDNTVCEIFFGMYGKMATSPYGTRTASLGIRAESTQFYFYTCSVKFLSEDQFYGIFRPSIDVLSPEFSVAEAALKIKNPENQMRQVCDILLDQEIFAGVGNIIKNEALFNAGILPGRLGKTISAHEAENLAACVREFSMVFLAMRMKGSKLSSFSRVYFKAKCQSCGGKISRGKCGTTNRITFWCSSCQK